MRSPTESELHEWLTPPGLWARYETLCEERPDVRATRYILGRRESQLAWLHSVGVSMDPRLSELVPAMPPKALREIVAESALEVFLWTGFVDVLQILTLFERHRQVTERAKYHLLDFGCGCGRLLRFPAAVDRWEACGVDANYQLAGWTRDNLPSAEVHRVPPAPPLPLSSSSFDLIYCLSVFSHLPEKRALESLAELHRLLRPGGVLVMTTHGVRALEIIANSVLHQEMIQISAGQAEEMREGLSREGFIYQRCSDSVIDIADVGDDYGNCFVDVSYITKNWAVNGFEQCEFLPGGLRGWQDVSVLRRNGGKA
ncbi:MAG: methyltransferase domain-containing protein [Thermoanaerobaculia bacterium]|nr:methyltransferase domain-containing protein [Thermoanaerobaculia bacterium]